MDWQMIGAVGEILGAGGVIATLGYLAAQIRSSTAAAQRRAAAELLDLNQALIAQITKDTESSALFRRGMLADPELTHDEIFRVSSQLLGMAMLWQRFYYLGRSQHLEDWLRTTFDAGRAELVRAPGFKRWFEGRGHWLAPEFREVLKREMTAPGGYRPGGDVTSEDSTAGPGTP